jgi:hypothetical protein
VSLTPLFHIMNESSRYQCLILICSVSLAAHLRVLLNPLNAEFNPICHLLALLGAHHIVHISWLRVNVSVQLLCLEVS